MQKHSSHESSEGKKASKNVEKKEGRRKEKEKLAEKNIRRL